MSNRGPLLRGAVAAISVLAAAACSGPVAETTRLSRTAEVSTDPVVSPEIRAMYDAVQDGDILVPAVPVQYLSEEKKRQLVDYRTDAAPGTIIVDPYARYLYHVREGGKAMRYSVAVGAAGYGFSGQATVAYTRKWPDWTPTQNMIDREPEKYAAFADGVEGGLDNPLGARALYLFRNGKDTLYRIHGTPSPWTIGHRASSGCIRMFNQDVMHLARQVTSGTKVRVLTKEESGAGAQGTEREIELGQSL